MKKQFFSLFLISSLIMSCASASTKTEAGIETETPVSSTPNSYYNSIIVSGIVGHEWKLVEVYINGNNTQFNRSTLPAEPGNFFTLNFDAQNISGVGVPNRYSAPYTLSEKTINIMLIRSTLMASFFQPENLTEHDFFTYLQNAYSWKLIDNDLELQSKTTDGAEVRLVFSL